jgi:hypothetical protein
MSRPHTGSPDKGEGRVCRPTLTSASSPDKTISSPQSRGAELLAQSRRRHAAAARLPGRDPLDTTEIALGCEREHPRTHALSLSEHDLVAWADACLFLIERGLPPIVPMPVCQALWVRGGADRQLAVHLARLRGAG